MHRGVTGPRELTAEQAAQLNYDLWEMDRPHTHWHVGDARGVDAAAAETLKNGTLTRYRSEGRHAWQLAARSTKMVLALQASGGTLHAWANKSCPDGLKPCKKWTSAKGSGTWGTIALAKGLGVRVELHQLTYDWQPPSWL